MEQVRAVSEGPLGFRCAACGFELWNPICELSTSALGLYDDQRFPGRCILVFSSHVESIEDVAEAEVLLRFMRDLQAVSRAVRKTVGALRVNVSFLGNQEPHLHAHLIPRVEGGDPVPQRSPWAHPAKVAPLDPGEKARLRAAIGRAALDERQRTSSLDT